MSPQSFASSEAPPSVSRAAASTTPSNTSGFPAQAVSKASATTLTSAASQSRIMYSAGLRMAVEEEKIAATIDLVIDLAEANGGGLLGRRDDAVDIRVAAENFRPTLQKLESMGTVNQRTVSAEDVTEQFHDLEVRLSNLKATQKRLQEFMARAANVTEAVTVERELERVSQEIDGIEGKLAFLKNRTAFSRITVAFQPRPHDVVVAASAAGKAKTPDLPVAWMSQIGLGPLLSLQKN